MWYKVDGAKNLAKKIVFSRITHEIHREIEKFQISSFTDAAAADTTGSDPQESFSFCFVGLDVWLVEGVYVHKAGEHHCF